MDGYRIHSHIPRSSLQVSKSVKFLNSKYVYKYFCYISVTNVFLSISYAFSVSTVLVIAIFNLSAIITINS